MHKKLQMSSWYVNNNYLCRNHVQHYATRSAFTNHNRISEPASMQKCMYKIDAILLKKTMHPSSFSQNVKAHCEISIKCTTILKPYSTTTF